MAFSGGKKVTHGLKKVTHGLKKCLMRFFHIFCKSLILKAKTVFLGNKKVTHGLKGGIAFESKSL